MDKFNQLLAESASHHDHLCPRQVIGVRMGLLAGKLLDLEVPQTQKNMFTFVESDGCFADGVAAATGCTLGHRTMRLVDYGKTAATFVHIKTQLAVRITPGPTLRALAAKTVPCAKSRWHAQLTAYQQIPDDLMFEVHSVTLHESLTDLISRPGVRVNCAICGEEIINEREVIVDNQTLCRACAGDNYYHINEFSLSRV